MEYLCPNCKTRLQWIPDNPNRPFCSERCKNRDFVAWANEKNCLPSMPDYDDMTSDDLLQGKSLRND